MKKAITGLFMLLALLACSMCAHAQEAMDITKEVAFHIGKGRIDPKEMVDRRYTTYYTLRKGGSFRVVSENQAISGVKVQFYEQAARCTVEALVENDWTEIGQVGAYLSDWITVPAGVTQLRRPRVFCGDHRLWRRRRACGRARVACGGQGGYDAGGGPSR